MSVDQLSSLNLMDANAVVQYISTELDKLVNNINTASAVKDLSTYPDFNTNFSVGRVPEIPLRQFIKRIVKYAPCSLGAICVCIVLIRRLKLYNGPSFINQYTIHRIIITGILIAAKYQDDIYFNNKYYARIGGVSTQEINKLELEFLARVRFDLYMDEEEENMVLERFRNIIMKE